MDLDWQMRLAAFALLNRLRDASGGVVRLADLEQGFDFDGEHILRISGQVGHPFRRMSDSCFGACRTPVSLDVGHLSGGGALDN